MKLPAIQFYVGDWRKDPGVQALDYETRGIWFEILCLMHESDERGVLLLNGKAMPEDALCCLLRLDKQNLTNALSKIEAYGVASRREVDGALICRRMIRDENIRKVRTDAGKQGGNPALLNQNPTTGVKQKSTPSSSSSTSINTPIVPKGTEELILAPAGPPPIVIPAWSAHQTRVNKLFNRRITTPWNERTLKLWRKLKDHITDDDLSALERYFAAAGRDEKLWRFQSLETLVSGWDKMMDAARNFKAPTCF